MVKYTWAIVPVYLFSVRRLRTERFTKTVEREHGHLSNEKKKKKEDLLSIGSWEKLSPVFPYFPVKASRGFPLDFIHLPDYSESNWIMK